MKYLDGDEDDIKLANETAYGYPSRGIPQDFVASVSIDDATGVGWTLQNEIVYGGPGDKFCCAIDDMSKIPPGLENKIQDEKPKGYDKIKEPKKEPPGQVKEVKEVK
jgi:hypothetical protein